MLRYISVLLYLQEEKVCIGDYSPQATCQNWCTPDDWTAGEQVAASRRILTRTSSCMLDT